MNDNLKKWFVGFETAVGNMDKKTLDSFFGDCAKNCVKSGVLPFYSKLYEECDHDLELFFDKLNKVEGVKTRCINSSSEYYLYFEKCTCHLHKDGYINTPLLCNCSKQSIVYVMKTILKDKDVKVEIKHTILGGHTDCKMKITIID